MRTPLDPSGDEARDLLERELNKPVYERESWLTRLVQWVEEWLQRLLGEAAAPAGTGLVVVIAVVVVLLALLTWAVFHLRRDRRAERGVDAIADAQVSSAELHARARAAYDHGDFSTAVIEGMRALTRHRVESGALELTPGLTAREAAEALAELDPARAAAYREAGVLFDIVMYGEIPATQAQADRVLSLWAVPV